jgi:hypothetical protein
MATKDFKLLGSDDGIYWATFNDIVIENADIALLQDVDRIRQDVVKFLLIQIGTVSMFPNYGTNIPFLMNNRSTDYVFEDLKNEIVYGVKYIQQINQNENVNIKTIQNINMSTPTPRELDMQIDLLLTNGEVLRIDQTVNL